MRSPSRPKLLPAQPTRMLLAGLLLLCLAAPAAAQETVPWRGSTMLYRNSGSAISLDKGAELTYNPYYAMTIQLSPRWWFGPYVGLFVDADVTRELTTADATTKDGEWWFGDLRGGLAGRLPTIPGIGLDVGGKLSLFAPTSKVSQARTMLLGVRPELTLSRTFDVLSGLTVAYVVHGTRYFHEYTTSQRAVPLIAGCAAGTASCDRHLNLGLRNPEYRLVNAVALAFNFTPWLGISADAAVVVDWLYPQGEADGRVSFDPQEGTDERYTMAYTLELNGKPMRSLSLALGASTVNPQLKPDSTMQEPFINRYTTLYFDLRFHIDGFIAQLRNPGGE